MNNHFINSNEDQEHKLPNQTFLSWLRSQTALFIGQIISIISTLYLFFALFYYSDPKHEGLSKFTPAKIQLIIHIAHLFFIAFFIIILLLVLNKNKIGSYRTGMVYRRIFNINISENENNKMKSNCNKAIHTFKTYFLFFWISMLLLYVSFLSKDYHSTKYIVQTQTQYYRSSYYEIRENQNILPIDFILRKDPKTINTIDLKNNIKESKLIDENMLQFHTDNYFEAFVHVFKEFSNYVMNNISLMFVFWCFAILYSPPIDSKSKNIQNNLIRFSAFIIFILILLFPLCFSLIKENGEYSNANIFGYLTIFNAISGILNAVALALLIARLDSKFIALPSLLVASLYMYSAVQPLFIAFSQPGTANEVIETAVLLAVFIFKIYFFFIILYILQTGRMYSYFFCFPTMNKRVDAIFQNQFEIITTEIITTGLKFRFIIMKGTELLFKTDNIYDDRENCRLAIEELRSQSMQKANFDIIESTGGTYLVKINNSEHKPFCFSSNLTSCEEAEDLVDETMEKLNCCKYDYS